DLDVLMQGAAECDQAGRDVRGVLGDGQVGGGGRLGGLGKRAHDPSVYGPCCQGVCPRPQSGPYIEWVQCSAIPAIPVLRDGPSPSAMTKVIVRCASWVIDRWMFVPPIRWKCSSTSPRRRKLGAPERAGTTSADCQGSQPGNPIAFFSASFAENRAAKDASV